MDTHILIEAFGYLGSLLVLVSMLMTSVKKLRIINTIGSLIFTIYAIIIKSYPTAFMNFCLILINLRFLWKMSDTEKEYEIVECDKKDTLLQYLLDHYRADIETIFPGIELNMDEINKVYVVFCEGKPVGMSLGILKDDEMELKLDYSIPEYRDFSIGSYLFDYIRKTGVDTITYKGPDINHKDYLNSQGFVKDGDVYIRKF